MLDLWAVTNVPHVLMSEPSLIVHENGILDMCTKGLLQNFL